MDNNGSTSMRKGDDAVDGIVANGEPRPKLKPLHWDKVRATSDRAMVWDQLKSSSFQLRSCYIPYDARCYGWISVNYD